MVQRLKYIGQVKNHPVIRKGDGEPVAPKNECDGPKSVTVKLLNEIFIIFIRLLAFRPFNQQAAIAHLKLFIGLFAVN